MHLDGLDIASGIHRLKSDDHTGRKGFDLGTVSGHCANTANLVDVLEG